MTKKVQFLGKSLTINASELACIKIDGVLHEFLGCLCNILPVFEHCDFHCSKTCLGATIAMISNIKEENHPYLFQ